MDGDRESQATRASVEVEMYPGTEIMRDDIRRSNHHLIHNHNSQASVVLIPQPSSNGDDPLVRKVSPMIVCRLYINICAELDPVMEMDRRSPPGLLHHDVGYYRPLCVSSHSCLRGPVPQEC